ncbi:peptide-methionine (R)-S-oxide reductase MsrB [Peptoniphilus stercorisuis]|uniref:peptide-methionine (R)-S-oxide reductase n=1 Tax=Peptoniphilus stercorisuis TaxID=1436965 RepID=A0ABS4K9X5_9FIRM|nr:peptide-methionine (R)-S-oxide reductase MsrB [Peptoniphilus stercorisuis]MBP2024564.1 methionine-R-sulfoxide reductase [Peptoniphilus stercorisuis]
MDYKKLNEKELKEKLTKIEYDVTQNAHTEMPFSSIYDNFYEEGIYVDITSGEPLFSSKDKFNAGCGWPSFSNPIDENNIKTKDDFSHGLNRTEVKSNIGNAHLGHVFEDGPLTLGGLRYCINGASLKFIKKEDLAKEGYEQYLELFEI